MTSIPPLAKTGSVYNTSFFSEPEIDDEIDRIITELPLEEQPEAWGALDERIGTEFFPIIPTAYTNDLLVFGSRIGNPVGDGALVSPYYKGLYVTG
jgi:peptide/nickel transport system substrate-binding protein